MKKNLILILIFSLFLTVGCSTSSNQIKNSANTISDIQHQIDDLAPNDGDSKEVAKTKKDAIKVLQEARKEIITEQQNNAKLEEEKDSLLSKAGIGKFMWALVACVILYFVVTLVKKFVP